jgi:HSP20 family protein
MKDTLLGTSPSTAVKIVNGASALNRIEQLYNSIAQRAYEIFEWDNRTTGRELDHWFRAEAELLHPVHVEIAESDEAVAVRAEVPGYKAEELEVSVNPRRVTITGNRESQEQRKTNKVVYTEHCANRIFRAFELPAEIDTSKSTATLKDGVLEVAMPKVTGAAKVRSATQSA